MKKKLLLSFKQYNNNKNDILRGENSFLNYDRKTNLIENFENLYTKWNKYSISSFINISKKRKIIIKLNTSYFNINLRINFKIHIFNFYMICINKLLIILKDKLWNLSHLDIFL